VAKRWTMPMSDIEDYALDDILQLAVFVVDPLGGAAAWPLAAGSKTRLQRHVGDGAIAKYPRPGRATRVPAR
jgi:hypothetical protein